MERESQFVGESGAFLDAVEKASRAAPLDRPVLVVGERGTGKELIAERLHRLSLRWDGPFITLNCAAMPETLIEAELFGHEAGAFTGATKARAGRFEEADGGTLFLDELGTLSTGAQERLLRAVELPPLRVREGDVPVLVDYFGRRMAAELEWPSWPGFGRLASEALNRHEWPGNVRELRNVVERAVYQWNDHSIPVDHIVFDPFASPWKPRESLARVEAEPDAPQAEEAPVVQNPPAQIESGLHDVDDMKAAVEAFEKRILETALAKSRYNQRQTAKALNLTYDQLRHSLKRHDLLGS